MRSLLLFTVLALGSNTLFASNPYHIYLLKKVSYKLPAIVFNANNAESQSRLSAAAYIPRYETPKGALFCRMEDKVTRSTKVWLKLGVQ